MADLLARLAERTLGMTEVARPLIPPAFAPLPQLAVGAISPAPSSVIAHAPRSEPDTPPLVQKTEQAADTKEFVLAPSPKMTEPRRAGEVITPTAKTQGLRNRVEQISLPATPHDWREPGHDLLAGPAAEQRRGAAEESRLPIEPSPVHRPGVVMPATIPRTRDADFAGRHNDDAKASAATSSDVPPWKQPALPTIPAAPSTSARAVTQEKDPVRSHEQSAPPVQVNIGRIEVRAVLPQPLTSPPVRRAAASALSLADYLKERDRGAR